MKTYLMCRRLDANESVGWTLQNAALTFHGAFKTRVARGGIPDLPLDPRFLYIEQGTGAIYHVDPETFKIARHSLDLTILMLGPEIAAALQTQGEIRIRLSPRLDGHPQRDRLVMDTCAAAFHGTHEHRLCWHDVEGRPDIVLPVNRNRLTKFLVHVLETAIANREIRVDGLLEGATLLSGQTAPPRGRPASYPDHTLPA